MAITMKSEYAMRLLVRLGIEGRRMSTQKLVSTCKTEVPKEFAEKILGELRDFGIINSYRGKMGGYELSKKAEEITMLDVVNAVDGSARLMTCFVDEPECPNGENCVIKDVWRKVITSVEGALRSVSLKYLLDEYVKRTGN
jgi:Rrf2 family protein